MIDELDRGDDVTRNGDAAGDWFADQREVRRDANQPVSGDGDCCQVRNPFTGRRSGPSLSALRGHRLWVPVKSAES